MSKKTVQNKEDIATVVADKTGISKNITKTVVDNAFSAIIEALAAKQTVAISGFGIFKVTERSARKGRNPRTGEEIQIPARNAVTFKSYGKLKDLLNV